MNQRDVCRTRSARVRTASTHAPIEGGAAVVVAPLQVGGTRHNSAAQFAQDQPDSLAMVASQDGRSTLFGWSPREGVVHARRIQVLLL